MKFKLLLILRFPIGIGLRDTFFFTLHEGSLQKLILEYVRYIFFKQVGIRGNAIMML